MHTAGVHAAILLVLPSLMLPLMASRGFFLYAALIDMHCVHYMALNCTAHHACAYTAAPIHPSQSGYILTAACTEI